MKTLLVTFGCSWTCGVGVGYEPKMSLNDYEKIAWNTDIYNKFSFRGLLSNTFNLTNINFSSGGSSNQKQFRLAKTFFSSLRFQQLQQEFDQILVLWGITATSRNEMFFSNDNQLKNFFYYDKSPLVQSIVKHSYNHEHEIFMLATEMAHWNTFFKNSNIKNVWFDTFNHHDYNTISPAVESLKDNYNLFAGKDWPSWEDYLNQNFGDDIAIQDEITAMHDFEFAQFVSNPPIENLLFDDTNPRDLLSLLAINNGLDIFDKKYHQSWWRIDSDRVKYLVDKKILNPISQHPTKLGHKQLADIFSDSIEQLINR